MVESWLGSLKGSAGEAKQRAAEDAAQRKAEGRRKGGIILNQKDVLTGSWDASKVLFTTIGGQLRPITADDLAAFRRNIASAQSQTGRFSKGITAKQVIDWSAGIVNGTQAALNGGQKSDLDRAKKEITMAVPTYAQNSADGRSAKVRFITNAGPDSDVSRHHVLVEFMNYGPEAASGLTEPRKAAMRLRQGPLKIECDCGRWRYWFRYLATIGGYNAGRAETGFPKIRNPKLQGIACKHIVRVMAEVQSGGATLGFLTKLMDKAKSSDEAKAVLRHKQAEAEKIIKNQAKRTTGNDIKTSEQKRLERSAKNAANAAKQAGKPQREKAMSKKISGKSPDEREAALRSAMAVFGAVPTAKQIRDVRNA
ncbi:MAG: hypothetical protein M0Q44_01335 [Methylobacter sp.]|jgi:hypothetical protein|nr:hypothetical protein [Methylobacter sp.]